MRVRNVILTGLTALVVGCSGGSVDEGTIYDPPQDNSTLVSGTSAVAPLPKFILKDPKPEEEPRLEDPIAQEEAPECFGDKTLERECETNNPCVGTQTNECVDGTWNGWSECGWIHETSSPAAVSKPVFSNGTVAAINFAGNISNNDVYAGTLEDGLQLVTSVKAASWLVSAGNYVGNVFSNNSFDNSNCQIIRVSDEAVLYDGICPEDFDEQLLVRKDGNESLLVFDYMNSEEFAWLDVGEEIKRIKIFSEYVAFSSKSSQGTSRVTLWDFVDEVEISFNSPEGSEDKDPLISGNHLVFARYNKKEQTVKLMRYDIEENLFGEIFEGNYLAPISNNCGKPELQEYNGMTLFADLDGSKLAFRNQTWYDLTSQGNGCSAKWGFGIKVMDIESCIEQKVVFYQKNLTLPTPSKPSIDDGKLVWGYGGKVLWCELEK